MRHEAELTQKEYNNLRIEDFEFSYVDKTSKGGTIGDLLDRSSELSSQRAEGNGGVDPLKEKYYKKYSKDRSGAVHPDKMPTKFEDKNVKIELD